MQVNEQSHSFVNLGSFSSFEKYVYHSKHEGVPSVSGKVFLRELLGVSSAEISINRFEPGFEIPFLHRHAENEEIYIVVSGKGQFQVDGNVFDLVEGSAVRVSKDGKRAWRAGKEDPLVMICIQAKADSCDSFETSDGRFVSNDVQW